MVQQPSADQEKSGCPEPSEQVGSVNKSESLCPQLLLFSSLFEDIFCKQTFKGVVRHLFSSWEWNEKKTLEHL